VKACIWQQTAFIKSLQWELKRSSEGDVFTHRNTNKEGKRKE